jgi:uncharacterized protein
MMRIAPQGFWHTMNKGSGFANPGLSISELRGNVSISLLVIQSTPFCNLDCDYCYLPNRNSKGNLSLDTLSHIIRGVFESGLLGKQLSVVWHAGEPLVTPIGFYEEAIKLINAQNQTGCEVSHHIQTNATLVDQAWCNFFGARGVRVGVSMDGPAFIHDAHRKRRSGRGTHEEVMRGIRLLKKNKIDFHVIAVVTRDSLDHADEIFDFFTANGIRSLGFNIDEIEAENKTSTLQGASNPYRAFMQRIFELSQSTPSSPVIREFERARQVILEGVPSVKLGRCEDPYNDQTVPFGIVSVDIHGNFSTFSPELLGHESDQYGSMLFGNFVVGSVESAISSERFQRVFGEIQQGVNHCRETCEYFALCGGGAPANKLSELGTFTGGETMYCEYVIKTPIDIVLSAIESELFEDSQR